MHFSFAACPCMRACMCVFVRVYFFLNYEYSIIIISLYEQAKVRVVTEMLQSLQYSKITGECTCLHSYFSLWWEVITWTCWLKEETGRQRV